VTAASREVIVLVPGIGNNARLWSHQAQTLANEYEVVIADYSGAESIEEMADRVVAQVTAASFSLVGFSLGGYVALQLMRSAAARVSRLALISTSPYADTEASKKNRDSLIRQALQDYPALLVQMGHFIVFPGGPNADTAREMLVTMGQELGVEEFCRQQQAAMHRADSREMLESIRCPVRVLCGREDKVTPVSGNQFLAEHIPGARLEIIEAAGHLLPLEKPQEVSAFLHRWLQGHSG